MVPRYYVPANNARLMKIHNALMHAGQKSYTVTGGENLLKVLTDRMTQETPVFLFTSESGNYSLDGIKILQHGDIEARKFSIESWIPEAFREPIPNAGFHLVAVHPDNRQESVLGLVKDIHFALFETPLVPKQVPWDVDSALEILNAREPVPHKGTGW